MSIKIKYNKKRVINKQKLKKILVIGICFLFLKTIYKNIKLYQEKFNPQKFSQLYSQSQFAENLSERKFIIRDHDLYSYAGWHYFKTGQLDKVNIEHPPLGKYLISLSILIFNNQNIGQLFWGILFLFLLYKLSLQALKDRFWALLIILLFSQEKLFQEQLSHSLLDLPLAVFLLIFLLTTTNKKPNKVLVQGISLGAIGSIKYPSIAFISLISLISYYVLKKEKRILKKIVSISLIASFVFLLSYLPFFLKNPNPLSFYHLQLKALKIHLSHVPEYPKGQVFNVLFFNRWLSWWGNKDFIKAKEWNFFWPILTISFFFSILKFKKNLLLNLWTMFYFIFLSSRLFFPRYLFLLIPFLYINLCYNLKLVIPPHRRTGNH